MPEIGWQELAGVFVALLVLGGVVAGALLHTRASIAARRGDLAKFNAVLKALETPELRAIPGPVYEHPLLGALPSYTTLIGTLDGFAICVELHSPSPDPEAHLEYVVRVRVTAPVGQAFDETRRSPALAGFDPQSFQTQVEGRSLIVAEKLGRTSTGEDLRASPATLGNHLRRVVDYARSITVAGPVANPQPPSNGVRHALSSKRIFLLDGDRRFVEALRAALIERGAQPHAFDDPQSLIDAAEQSRPDLFVVALELPGEHGWAVCNRLKKLARVGSVPLVVTCTGCGEAEFQVHRRLRTRAQDYVAKPVSVEEMLARMAAQVRGA